MKLLLEPPDMPRIWACSENHAWMIKRSKPFANHKGQRLYSCEMTNTRASEPQTFKFWENSLIRFIDRFQAVAGLKEIKLIQKIGDVEYNLLDEGHERDSGQYGDGSRKPTKQITTEDLEQAMMMFDHMEGDALSRCRWIAKVMGKGMPKTWRKRIKEFNQALEASQ